MKKITFLILTILTFNSFSLGLASEDIKNMTELEKIIHQIKQRKILLVDRIEKEVGIKEGLEDDHDMAQIAYATSKVAGNISLVALGYAIIMPALSVATGIQMTSLVLADILCYTGEILIVGGIYTIMDEWLEQLDMEDFDEEMLQEAIDEGILIRVKNENPFIDTVFHIISAQRGGVKPTIVKVKNNKPVWRAQKRQILEMSVIQEAVELISSEYEKRKEYLMAGFRYDQNYNAQENDRWYHIGPWKANRQEKYLQAMVSERQTIIDLAISEINTLNRILNILTKLHKMSQGEM